MSVKKTTILFIFLFAVFANRLAFAQKPDSLVQLLKTAKDDTNKVKTINNLVYLYTSTGNYDAALQYANQAKTLAQQLNFKRGEAVAYNKLGLIYYDRGDYADAIKNQFNFLECAEQIKNKNLIATAYEEIANVNDAQGNYENAIKYYVQSLEIRKELNDKVGLAQSYNNIGTMYAKAGKPKLEIEFYQKSLAINLEINNTEEIAINYANIGSSYKEQAEYEKAIEYTQKSIQIDEQYGYTEGACAGYFNMADLYYLQKDYKTSSKYYDKALKTAKDLGIKDYLKEGYLSLTNLDSALGDYKAVYHDYKNFITYRDSLNNEENTKKTLEEQYKYDLEKKEALAAEESRRQRLVLWLIGIVALGITIVAVLIYRSLQQNKKAKKIIELKSKETEEQKHLVEHKQKEIIDSITYAKRLQQAILPSVDEINKYVPDNFLYYKPKDIVAGDFYWMEHLDNTTYIAAADSTGHGVPGAMVSVVCSNALNRAVNEFGLRDTGKILDKTRELVLETFEKSGEEIKDGMDISMCRINSLTNEVQWSGANNQLWYITKASTELIEIKANKQPIGKTDNPQPFTTHTLQLQKGDIIYLMTDGYPDQFGGEKGKKYKYKQLEQNLIVHSTQTMAEQKNILSANFDAWKGELEQVDDVTILGIRI